MNAEVVDIALHASKLQVSRSRHPAGGAFRVDSLGRIPDPAAALTKVARDWDRLHTDLTSGIGALTDCEAREVLTVMVTALVHPTARAALVFTWDKVLDVVRRHDAVMDSDMEPLDIGCTSYAQAAAKVDSELSWELFPLIHGLPSRDACTDCTRTCSSVNAWQTRLGCTNHGGR